MAFFFDQDPTDCALLREMLCRYRKAKTLFDACFVSYFVALGLAYKPLAHAQHNLVLLKERIMAKKITIQILLISTVVGTLFMVNGCFASKEEKMLKTAQPFYSEALDYFLTGQLDTALGKVMIAIDKYNTYIEAHILYQRIKAKKLEMRQLLNEYRKLMQQFPNDPEYVFLYARLLDDLDEQARLYKKSIDMDKDFSWGYFGLGYVAYKTDRLNDAAAYLEQAIKLDPANAFFHLNLGSVYYLMRLNRDAELEFVKAVELSPKLVEGWLNLATVYYQNPDYEKAVEALRKYLNLYPAAPDFNDVQKKMLQISGGRT